MQGEIENEAADFLIILNCCSAARFSPMPLNRCLSSGSLEVLARGGFESTAAGPRCHSLTMVLVKRLSELAYSKSEASFSIAVLHEKVLRILVDTKINRGEGTSTPVHIRLSKPSSREIILKSYIVRDNDGDKVTKIALNLEKFSGRWDHLRKAGRQFWFPKAWMQRKGVKTTFPIRVSYHEVTRGLESVKRGLEYGPTPAGGNLARKATEAAGLSAERYRNG